MLDGGKRVVAIIPARGGSKGLPRKNIKMFNGYPLIYWSIKAALESSIIDDVYVNSDDNDILKLAHYYGANTFKRPDIFAQDTSRIFETLDHFNTHIKSDILVMLNPTSPVRTGEFIDDVLKQFNYNNYDLLATCKESLEFECGSRTMANRQDMKPFAYDNGSIYAFDSEYITHSTEFYPQKTLIQTIITPQEFNYEIDSALDFDIVELIHKKYI
jgi:N-acylneuraminate cytidylyltransferase